MKAVIFTLLCILSLALHATKDSLLQVLSASSDAEEVSILLQLSEAYEQIDLDSALLYAQQAVDKAQTLKDDALLAEAQNGRGIILDYLGQYDNALTAYETALSLYRKLGDEKGEAGTLINMGLVMSFQAKMDSTLVYYDSALTLSKKIGQKHFESYVLHNISSVHIRQGHYRLALDYLLKSLSLKEELNDVPGQITSLYNLGLVYYELKLPKKALLHYATLLQQYSQVMDKMTEGDTYHNMGLIHQNALHQKDSALYYYHKALSIRESLGYQDGISETLSNLSMLFLSLGEVDTARQAIDRALSINIQTQDWNRLSIDYNHLAKIYLQQQNYREALLAINKAESIIDSFNLRLKAPIVWQTKMQVLRKLGRWEDALHYYDQYTQLSDSILNAKISDQLLELETQFQSAKKDQSILQQQLTLDSQALTIARKNRWISLAGFGLLSLSLILFLLFKNYRQKKVLYRQEVTTLKKEQELQRLKAMMAGEEQERTRIAKNLHDGVSGMLSAVKLYFSALSRDQPEIEETEPFTKAKALLDDTASEVRTIAHNLMPDLLLREGLVTALRQFCDHIQSSGLIAVDFQAINIEEKLPQPLALTLYRIMQELLNNILKHANASEVLVQLARQGQRIECTVEDNGRGFRISQNHEGTGLNTIRHRIQHLDGELDIDSKEGHGTSVHIIIHLDKQTS